MKLMLCRYTYFLALFASCSLSPKLSFAQSESSAQAESLFRDGLELLETGDYEKACSALRASHRLEPAVGTLLNLARCYEQAGLTASAWTTFSEVVGMARREGQSDRAELARSEASRLRPLVPKVNLQVEGLEDRSKVELDGRTLEHAVLEFGIAVDPGAHEVVVTHLGKQPLRKAFSVEAVEEQEPLRVSVGFEDGVKAPSAAPAESITSEARPPFLSEHEKKDSKGTVSSLRWVGVGVGAAGLVGAIAGTLIGTSAMRKAKDADCSSTGCSESGLEQRSAARAQLRTGSVIGFVGGGVAVGGITLFALAPSGGKKDVAVRAQAFPGGGSQLGLLGRF